jgi:hypothetical protein
VATVFAFMTRATYGLSTFSTFVSARWYIGTESAAADGVTAGLADVGALVVPLLDGAGAPALSGSLLQPAQTSTAIPIVIASERLTVTPRCDFITFGSDSSA